MTDMYSVYVHGAPQHEMYTPYKEGPCVLLTAIKGKRMVIENVEPIRSLLIKL